MNYKEHEIPTAMEIGDDVKDTDCVYNKGWCYEKGYNQAIYECTPIIKGLQDDNNTLKLELSAALKALRDCNEVLMELAVK